MTVANVPNDSQGKYQLFGRLRPEEYAALEADIKDRGVQVAVEVDSDGNILDGHHRVEIAEKLDIPYDTIIRKFRSEQQKREHVVKLNLARRHLDPIRWGQAFARLCQERGVRLGSGRQPKTATIAVFPETTDASEDTAGKREASDPPATATTVAEVAAELGVPERTARHRLAQAKALEALPAEAREEVASGAKTLQQVRREEKEGIREARREENRQLVEAAPSLEEVLGEAKFATIVVDPPWSPADEGEDRGEGLFGRGHPPYETMSVEEIENLPVGTFADEDCHIYLWITNRSLFKGETLLTTWGFRYVTTLTWCKPHFGMGKYFRGSTEHVLFGVKGSQPLKRQDVGTWFQAPRGPDGHSSKPVEFYDLVESCSPGPYLEIFARGHRDGWTSWGAEAIQIEGTAS